MIKHFGLAIWYALKGQWRFDPDTREYVSAFGKRRPVSAVERTDDEVIGYVVVLALVAVVACLATVWVVTT